VSGQDIRTAILVTGLTGLVAQDADAVALAEALDPELQEIATLAEQCALLSRISSLTMEQADEVAAWFSLSALEGWGLATLAAKRTILAEMVDVYRRRGTPWALDRVLSILETPASWDDGAAIWDDGSAIWDSRDGMYTVTEWWEQTPPDPSCTYRVDAAIVHRGLSLDELRHLDQVLEAYVPLRAHLHELSESIALESPLLCAGYCELGLLIEVTP